MAENAIDLKAVAKDLPQGRIKLKGLIDKCSDASSIRHDLVVAFEMICAAPEAVRLARAAGGRSVYATQAVALINSAVIFYARATKTSSDHRRRLDFVRKFNELEKQRHKMICELRDGAIAHFGPGDIGLKDPFHDEGIFIPLDNPDNMKIFTASRRIFHQNNLERDLRSQIHRALIISEMFAQTANNKLTDYLNENFEDGFTADFLQNYRVNLRDFFKQDSVVSHILGGSRTGTSSGTVEH